MSAHLNGSGKIQVDFPAHPSGLTRIIKGRLEGGKWIADFSSLGIDESKMILFILLLSVSIPIKLIKVIRYQEKRVHWKELILNLTFAFHRIFLSLGFAILGWNL